jgi:hypothetical protein
LIDAIFLDRRAAAPLMAGAAEASVVPTVLAALSAWRACLRGGARRPMVRWRLRWLWIVAIRSVGGAQRRPLDRGRRRIA